MRIYRFDHSPIKEGRKMKRLTKRINGNEYALCGNVIYAKCENCQNRLPKCYEDDCHTEIEVLQKLATYEDSNLSPEEVMEMKSLCEKTYDDLRYRLRKYEQAVEEAEKALGGGE